MNKQPVLVLFIGVIFLFAFSLHIQADAPLPVIGGGCSQDDQVYHSVTSERTPWQINELYAVPVGTLNPDSWEQHMVFHQDLVSALQAPCDAQAFANACGSVWHNYFASQADVLVSFKRTITMTDEALICISGSWVLQSTQTFDEVDVSDWVAIDTNLDVTSSDSVSTLSTDLQNELQNLNSQPGAANQGQ